MTLEELITLYREQAFDKAIPPFCSDDLLAIYANEAETEACRRGDLLRDSSSDFCTLDLVADDESVPLDPRIVRIIRARINGETLCVVNADDMDFIFPSWQDDTSRNQPTHLIEGVTTGQLYLWPRPKEAGSIKLTVQRMPIEAMTYPTDTPEIRAELHMGLVDWLLYRAYSREDTELYNDTKAALSMNRFVAEFGRKASGRNEAWQRHGSSINAGPIA